MGDRKNIQVGLKSTEIQPTSYSRGAIWFLKTSPGRPPGGQLITYFPHLRRLYFGEQSEYNFFYFCFYVFLLPFSVSLNHLVYRAQDSKGS